MGNPLSLLFLDHRLGDVNLGVTVGLLCSKLLSKSSSGSQPHEGCRAEWQAGQQKNTDHAFCHLLAAPHHQCQAPMPGGLP